MAPCFSFVCQFVLRLVLFLTGKYNFDFLCLPVQPTVLYFSWTVLTLLMGVYIYVYIYVCIFHYFNYYLPDFVTAICLGFIFGFLVLGICFTLT